MPKYKIVWLDDPQFAASKFRTSRARGVSADATYVFGSAELSDPSARGPRPATWKLAKDEADRPIGVTQRRVTEGVGGALFTASPDGYGAGFGSSASSLDALIVRSDATPLLLPAPQPTILALSGLEAGSRYAVTAGWSPRRLQLTWKASPPSVTAVKEHAGPANAFPLAVNASGWVGGYTVQAWSGGRERLPSKTKPIVWTVVSGAVVSQELPMPASATSGVVVHVSDVKGGLAYVVVNAVTEETFKMPDLNGVERSETSRVLVSQVMSLRLQGTKFTVVDTWSMARPGVADLRYPSYLASYFAQADLAKGRARWSTAQHWNVVSQSVNIVDALGEVVVGFISPWFEGWFSGDASRAFITVLGQFGPPSAIELSRLVPDFDPERERLVTAEEITPQGHIIGWGERKIARPDLGPGVTVSTELGYIAVLIDATAGRPSLPDASMRVGGQGASDLDGVSQAFFDRPRMPIAVVHPDRGPAWIPPMRLPRPEPGLPRTMREDALALLEALSGTERPARAAQKPKAKRRPSRSKPPSP